MKRLLLNLRSAKRNSKRKVKRNSKKWKERNLRRRRRLLQCVNCVLTMTVVKNLKSTGVVVEDAEDEAVIEVDVGDAAEEAVTERTNAGSTVAIAEDDEVVEDEVAAEGVKDEAVDTTRKK